MIVLGVQAGLTMDATPPQRVTESRLIKNSGQFGKAMATNCPLARPSLTCRLAEKRRM